MNIRVFTTWLCEILAFVVFDSDLSCFSLKKRSITDLFAEPASHCYVFPPALAALSLVLVPPAHVFILPLYMLVFTNNLSQAFVWFNILFLLCIEKTQKKTIFYKSQQTTRLPSPFTPLQELHILKLYKGCHTVMLHLALHCSEICPCWYTCTFSSSVSSVTTT